MIARTVVVSLGLSLAGLVATAGPARADAPLTGGIFRATPGFSYAWDASERCEVDGAAMAGGFVFGGFVAPGLLVGAAADIRLHGRADGPGCDGLASDGRLALAMTAGPTVEWYPRGDGLYVLGAVGFAEISQELAMTSLDSRGIGGKLGVGHDWWVGRSRHGADSRIGVVVQISIVRTLTAHDEHTTIAPAALMSFSID